jgi:putative nucleotidyltransferase with HDIG domain
LKQLRAQLRNTIVEVTTAPTMDRVDPQILTSLQFSPPDSVDAATAKKQAEEFREFRAVFTPQENLERFETALAKVFAPFEQRGLLEKLDQELNQEEILVHPLGKSEPLQLVKVGEVLMGDRTALRDSLRAQSELSPVADRLFAWIEPRLKPTLTLDDAQTKRAKMEAAALVKDVVVNYSAGQVLARVGQPLGAEQIELLELEYDAAMNRRPVGEKLERAGAVIAMVFVAFLLCGIQMRWRQRGPLTSLTRLIVLLLLAITTVAAARWASADAWRGEIVPLLLFGMVMAIVYRQELALMLSGILSLIIVVAIGHGLPEMVLLLGVTATAVLNLGSIRTRSKLIYVGLFAGAVAVLLEVDMRMIDGNPLDLPLLKDASRNALWAIAAGFLTTGLLPFIEQVFGVLTDLSLLELGDVAHPLLQELVRRAPSTYNHSITVGSIAEAAAESIGARGLLVRVGSYFHDIGKMLKPDYFIENQGRDVVSRHEALVPAMSTLVIIAHIKDGADLARQHRLPQPIIDLIVQHHGTTLVEFFFDRATEKQHADPNGGEVDESSFRYPGPKPQTKEAAVLMLADAVESASRTLVEPTPARIESLIRDIAESRLRGGQFDESGLTLRELRTIEKSMAVSLTSIYHGRIKYPEQRTA